MPTSAAIFNLRRRRSQSGTSSSSLKSWKSSASVCHFVFQTVCLRARHLQAVDRDGRFLELLASQMQISQGRKTSRRKVCRYASGA